MVTEDYVSVKVAKLLKEKGFDWEVHRSYLVNDNCFAPADVNDLPYRKDAIRIPTLQMAMKWLRETFEIHCQIDCPIAAFNWRYGIRNLNQDEWVTLRNMGDYETYEEACEAAIRYCLENLI